MGAEVDYYDPWVAEYRKKGRIVKGLKDISPEVVNAYDLVMITTAHTNVDYEMVQKNAKVIFDTKNVTENLPDKENIEIL